MKEKYKPQKMFFYDEIYKQHFWLIHCKKIDLNKTLASILNTTIDKVNVDVEGFNGNRFTLENIEIHDETDFIFIDYDYKDNIKTLEHELLHQAFKVFDKICSRYTNYEREEPFCYYYDYLKEKTKNEFIKKFKK